MTTFARFARYAAIALASAVLLPAISSARAQDAGGAAQNWDEAKEAIWTKELAIYEGRSRGDLSIYLANTARGYKAWPPFNPVPKGNEGLEATGKVMKGKTKERLEMTFLDLVLHGDFAVVYYKTHRTRLADGTAVDQRYEVTHSWVREDGVWKVIGGMARIRPERE